MTAISILYASAPDNEVAISTLEIMHPAIETIRICDGYENHTVTLETGQVVTFEASGLDVSLPKRDATGQQNLTFAIENVTGIAQNSIRKAMEAGGLVTITYRMYRSVDLSEPAERPISMVLINPSFRGTTTQVTCSYFDLINFAWPRRRYTVEFAPGLKYIA